MALRKTLTPPSTNLFVLSKLFSAKTIITNTIPKKKFIKKTKIYALLGLLKKNEMAYMKGRNAIPLRISKSVKFNKCSGWVQNLS